MTVIEHQVHRTAAENARFAFILAAILTGILALVIAADYMHPLLAIFVAAPIAVVSGGLAWTFVRIWPVLRVLWWWSFEIIATGLLGWGWTVLALNTTGYITLTVLFVVFGLPAFFPQSRRLVVSLFWCVAVRHRLRVCFSQFITANRSGSLPLIFWSRRTPVGERVWVMLRPGLSLAQLAKEEQLARIAVACHALPGGVLVEKAGTGSSAFVRFDIKRREVLTAKVNSPLVDLIDPEVDPEVAGKEPATVTGLDLPDVHDTTAPGGSAQPKPAASGNGRKPAANPSSSSAAADDGDDVNQWI